ncbi:MAG: hypothetical protein ACRD59_14745 [Candidatus Acidiferrales bacterium]
MFIVIAAAVFWLIRFTVICIWAELAQKNAKPSAVTLNIGAESRGARPLFRREVSAPTPAPKRTAALPEPLCIGCVYAHIVRGFRPEEELIACGYAFPARELLFRVRECSDYRPKRERCRVEKANEGAVCILPLDETAETFHAAAATRNGEGEVESSYD